MGFFEDYERKQADAALGSGSQNDTRAICAGCGLERDDVLLGYCGRCELTPVQVTAVD